VGPLAQYDHDDGASIIGGFVYRGSHLPGLDGMYVFGDFGGFGGVPGRLFYLDPDEVSPQIYEFRIGVNDDPLATSLIGFGQDADGEMYVLLDNGDVNFLTNVWADFDHDGDADVDDLNALLLAGDLVAGVAAPPADTGFDGTGDGTIDTDDLNQWLMDAATINGEPSAYLRGDTELDRDVDISDFNALATNFDPGGVNFAINTWGLGDFDGDGDIDITDFNTLASNFQPSGYDGAAGAEGVTFAPEPASAALLALGGLLMLVRRKR